MVRFLLLFFDFLDLFPLSPSLLRFLSSPSRPRPDARLSSSLRAFSRSPPAASRAPRASLAEHLAPNSAASALSGSTGSAGGSAARIAAPHPSPFGREIPGRASASTGAFASGSTYTSQLNSLAAFSASANLAFTTSSACLSMVSYSFCSSSRFSRLGKRLRRALDSSSGPASASAKRNAPLP